MSVCNRKLTRSHVHTQHKHAGTRTALDMNSEILTYKYNDIGTQATHADTYATVGARTGMHSCTQVLRSTQMTRT